MTQPQYAPQPYAPQYPYAQQPADPYAQQPHPGMYQQPYAPQQPQMPQQPGGYQQPQQPQGPPAGAAAGSLDAFFAQPSVGGGKAWSWAQKPVGTEYIGVVARAVGAGDVEHQTIPGTQNLAYFRDGTPKFVMKVPMNVPAAGDHPDGKAQWYCQGAARDELLRAMTQAGAPQGPPEAGALVRVKLTGTRPSGPGKNPSNIYEVTYWRPAAEIDQFAAQLGIAVPSEGERTAPAPAPAAAPAPEAPSAPEQPAQAPQPPAAPAAPQAPAQPQQAAPAAPAAPQPPAQPAAPAAPAVPAQPAAPAVEQAPAPQAPAQPAAPAAPAPPAAQPAAPAAAGGELPEDKAALLARLTSQQG